MCKRNSENTNNKYALERFLDTLFRKNTLLKKVLQKYKNQKTKIRPKIRKKKGCAVYTFFVFLQHFFYTFALEKCVVTVTFVTS